MSSYCEIHCKDLTKFYRLFEVVRKAKRESSDIYKYIFLNLKVYKNDCENKKVLMDEFYGK